MNKQEFEEKFYSLWFQGQTEAEKLKKWLPSKRPAQVVEEYLEYLWIVSSIKNPAVLEIGVKDGHQRRFYEQLLGCRDYCGVDINPKTPATIVGDSQDLTFVQELRMIRPTGYDIIFIDGNHTREGVRANYETYKGMVRPGGYLVIHDIMHDHWEGADGAAVLWKQIKDDYPIIIEIFYPTDYMPYQKGTNNRKKAGIGVIPIS